MRTSRIVALAAVAAWLVFPVSRASAQVLIWNLPKEDGSWVRFEGSYKQTRARPNSNLGDEVLEWRSELTIGAVGSEAAEFDGKPDVPCRWVEFKALTKPNGLNKQPGPGDTFVYKVLIPADRVVGKTVDDHNLPITFLPIVKGWRKVGQREPEPVSEKALAIYPTIAMVTYYPNLKAEGEETELQIADATVKARVYKGSRILSKATSRSTNTASLWRSDEVPFGLARYQVSVTIEQKEIAATADEFRRTSLIEVDMSAVAIGNDARSELGDAR